MRMGLGLGLRAQKGVVTPIAYDYLVHNATELAALMTTPGVATLSGKTIAMAPGDYAWSDATWANRAYTSETRFASLYPTSPARIVCAGNYHWAAPKNVTWDNLIFYAPFTVGVDSSLTSCLTLTGTVDGLTIKNCDLSANLLALVVANGYPDVMTDWTWRGLLGFDGTTATGAGGMKLTSNRIHGSWRLLNIGPGVVGPNEIVGNEMYDFGVDATVIAEGQVGLKYNWNYIHAPLSGWNGHDHPGTFNPANDRFTTATPHGWTGTLTLNFSPNTGAVPVGLSLTTDYSVTVIDSVTLQWPAHGTTAGTDVRVYQEPAHADFMQGIPGAHDWNGFEFIGNVFVAAREDAITTDHDAQVIFLEDINAANTDANHYSNGTIAGNVIYSESNFGIALYNPINCRIVNNSMMGLIDGAGSRVPIEINQHFPTGTGSGNTILNNITTAASSVFSGDRVKANILVGPSSASYLTAFTGPTTAVPTTKAGILAQQTILSGSTADRQEPKAGAVGTGYFDYTARTYSLPTYPTYDLSGFVVTPQSTSAWLDVSTTSGSGTIYWMVSATPKTRAEVIAQGTATAKGTQAVSATGAQAQITATGLSPTTSYLFYIVQVNGSSVQSQMLYATGTTLVASSWNRVNSSAPARLIKTGGFSSATDTKTGTFAWRGKLLGNDGAFRKLITNGGVSFDVGFRTDNSFRISMFNSAVVEVLRLGTTGVTFNVALGEILLICSWDAAAGRSELYVNGTSRVVRTTVTNDFSAFTKTTNMGMFADYAGATPNNCETDYLLFDNAFVDIAVAGNRAIFDNSSLLGSDGSGATGQQPLVYVTGTASAWNGSPGTANLGRGGQFTSSGSFANV